MPDIQEMSDADLCAWEAVIKQARSTHPQKFEEGSPAREQARAIDAEILRRKLR